MRGLRYFLVWLVLSGFTGFVTYAEINRLLATDSYFLANLTAAAAIVAILTMGYVLFWQWRHPK